MEEQKKQETVHDRQEEDRLEPCEESHSPESFRTDKPEDACDDGTR
ncbi:MAG: hypothetical protein WHT81_01375 [Rectinemataceae bacterium]|nr:hypothetical protein [Spirochaetaceae bacterium]